MAAFDAALRDAGVADFNLLILSSIIPPGSKVVEIQKKPLVTGKWGDRLYVVLAEERVDSPNVEAWAGLGWVQDKTTGKGLFVEHHGASEARVKRDIIDTLTSMTQGRKERFGPIQMQVQGITCHGEPVCSLVVAAYQSNPWSP